MVIYKAVNKINGKMYIGMTMYEMEERKINHLSETRNGSKSAFHNAIRKYGEENFEWSVVCQYFCVTFEELGEYEKYYIKLYDSYNNGYNMTLGGDGTFGRKYTKEEREIIGQKTKNYYINNPEERKRISKQTKERWENKTDEEKKDYIELHYVGENNGFYGKNHSEEFKKNRSENNPAKRIEVRQKMRESRLKRIKEFPILEKTRKKFSESSKGRKCIYRVENGIIVEKRIKPENLNEYLQKGWILGQKKGKSI